MAVQKGLLRLLQTRPLYAQLRIFSFSYTVTMGDLLHLPYRLPDVRVGDTLDLRNLTTIGSRELTLTGSPLLDRGLFSCRARVVELTRQPMSFVEKTKRRQRRVKTVKSKQKVTVLRINELRINDQEAV